MGGGETYIRIESFFQNLNFFRGERFRLEISPVVSFQNTPSNKCSLFFNSSLTIVNIYIIFDDPERFLGIV